MLYIQQFQYNRQDYLRQYQRIHLLVNENFLLSSNQYNKKFPHISRPTTLNVGYSHNQTLFFLPSITSLNMDDVRSQSASLWSDHASNKSTIEHRTKTGNKDSMANLHKSSIADYNKKISNENNEKFSTFTRRQVYSNVYRLAQSTTIGNQLSTSVLLPNSIPTKSDRPTTAPLIFEKNIHKTVSEKFKSAMLSRSPTPLRNARLIDSSDIYDNSTNSLYYEVKSTVFKNDNPFMQQSSHINTNSCHNFLDSPIDTNSHNTTTINNDDESQIHYRSSQYEINGFQHIAKLGSWQRSSKNREIVSCEKSKEIEHEEEISKDIDQPSLNSSSSSTTTIYKYKSPFSEEYDNIISLYAQCQTNNNINEFNLRDFYRDVKTQFEPETNTKPVFEKCLKLARLQANTIKWEQRRRQNLIIYNRLIKNGTFDNNILNSNGIYSSKINNEKDIRDINELKRELRCNECKRLACLGNCAPGNEYHQYKRFPFSSLSNIRDQNRTRLNLRTQRSTIDLRPYTTQQTTRETKFKFEQTNTNPIVVVPLMENELQTKRSHKKLTHRYLSNKSLRSQRRETLTVISTPKISS
ncbi:unnamed protein product [Rotaria sordida]|uniref:Uncharacterized protein n=1 Tax=Rotaria sordida TaxID=392033 RepID=A0A814CRU5_9BILA|nr:unnamed protein product [Rotaria sordida]